MSHKRIVETELRVRYAETDAMGVVYHANYLVWFEVGRGDFFRAAGQDYGKWERHGVLLPVSEVYARYHAPARFGDLITVRTWVEKVRSRGLTLNYEVRDSASQRRLVSGWSKHICADAQGQAQRLPKEMIQSLEES